MGRTFQGAFRVLVKNLTLFGGILRSVSLGSKGYPLGLGAVPPQVLRALNLVTMRVSEEENDPKRLPVAALLVRSFRKNQRLQQADLVRPKA